MWLFTTAKRNLTRKIITSSMSELWSFIKISGNSKKCFFFCFFFSLSNIYNFPLLARLFDVFHITGHNKFLFCPWFSFSPSWLESLDHFIFLSSWKVFWLVIYSLSDTTPQLHRFSCCLWTLWHVKLSKTFGYDSLQFLLHSTPKLTHFRCAHTIYSQHGSFHLCFVISCCYSFFMVVHVSLVHNCTGKIVLCIYEVHTVSFQTFFV